MILTVTLNPSIDISYPLEELKLDTVNRVSEVSKTAGGKGLNVTRVLAESGETVGATGFVGGTNGQFIKTHLPRDVQSFFYDILGDTRNCIAILHEGNQTEILEAGPEIIRTEALGFLHHFKLLMPTADVIAISGSLPTGLPVDYYASLIEIAKEAGRKVVLDSSGKSLEAVLHSPFKPTVIKPNREELSQLLGRDVSADFDTSKVTESFNMFAGRTKLRGGEGSFEANPSQAGIEWLKIDRPGVRGYFTNVNKRTISSLSIMQNVDAGVCANSNLHEVATLVDVRDGNTYTVAKLKDNKCWMTQNLRLVNKTLTPVDSDVSANFTVPASNLNVANAYGSSTVLPMVYYNSSRPQDGAYYNWFTATAGMGGRNIPEGVDASSSVCPSGWRLSYGGSRSEYLTLLNRYDGNVANLRGTPLNFITPGYVHERNLIGINSNGLYWSSTAGPANWAHRMSIWGNNSDQGSSWQVDGALVRCLVK